MAGKPELSEDEIEELRDFLRGRRAVVWLFTNARGIATWVAAIIGAWLAFSGALASWLRKLLGDVQ